MSEDEIVNVWEDSLEEEFDKIRRIIISYPYVAMDTEFPGVVARPYGEFRGPSDYQYQLLKTNVNMLKIIQLGITFYDRQGKRRPGTSTWQFNFRFSLSDDMYAQDSIDMLNTAGIDFKLHEEGGIDPVHFAELMMMSGLVLTHRVNWIAFHSQYDFGYLLKVLTGEDLPESESVFFGLMSFYFSRVYDVKYLMKSCKNLKGGLQDVADQLDLERVGQQHQAGSDSLITGEAFFRMKSVFFDDDIDDSKYCGHLYGLGSTYSSSNGNGYTVPES
jgi:CCR4-NOT transcription complex subunit 7/8